MAAFDFSDFYIQYPNHPNFNDIELIEDEIIRVIVQKYEMIIFTNPGDLLGDPEFGGDLSRLLYKTKVSSKYVERRLNNQISTYIPELNGITYELNIRFEQNPASYSDIMFIDFKIKGLEVNAFFG